MVKHKLISFANVIALWTLVTLLIKLIRVLLMWKYIQDLMFAILVALLRKRLFLSKKCCPGYRTGAYIWESFLPVYRDLGRKNWDLGNWASPAFHVNTSKFGKEKSVEGRSQNRAIPVVRAHIKRGPKSVSMRKSIKPIEHKSPLSIELDTNSYLGKWMIVAKKYVKIVNSPQVRTTPCRSGNLTQIYAYLTTQLF